MVENDSSFDRWKCGSDAEGRGRGRRSHGAGRRGRKERVLHTRVSESLADDIRRIAEDLRVPASNLVRNVLEEVFDVVESVSDDVGGLFEEMLDEAEAARERISRSRHRRGRRVRDREGGRDRAAWRAARAEVEEAERTAAKSAGSPPAPPVEWHFVQAGRAVGPLRRDELAAAARSGRLGRETLVWSAGMEDWRPAGEVATLAELFAPPPVPGDGSEQQG